MDLGLGLDELIGALSSSLSSSSSSSWNEKAAGFLIAEDEELEVEVEAEVGLNPNEIFGAILIE